MIIKKRVYFDATPLVNKHVSGVGKVLLETLRALDVDEYLEKYDLYAFIPLNEAGKLEKYGFKNIKVKLLPYPHKFLSLFSRMRLSPPIDVFLGKGIYIFENYRNWNLLFSKSITYIHDITFKVHPEFVQEANLKYLNNHIDMWIDRTDKLVTVSESSKQEIQQQLAINNVEVILNASDDDMYPRGEQEVRAVRKKWSIPERYFVYFGNIEPRKNLVNTIKAFTEYAKETEHPVSLILIGGDGWKNEEIYKEIEIARKKGVEIIRPKRYIPDADMPAILSGAVALVQLSWHEGFGMSLLHALACGTPVVASDIPALHEAARANEANIVWAEPSDLNAIVRALKEAESKKHVKNPKNIIKWRKSVKSLEKIIDSL